MVEHPPSCRECSGKLIGRSDKRFCSDHCRSSFNNRRYRQQERSVKAIGSKLRKNRNILSRIRINYGHDVDKEILAVLGFEFDYFTHVTTSTDGQLYKVCYDEGYRAIGEKRLELRLWSKD